MKNLKYFIIFIFVLIFLSACSSSYTISFVTNSNEELEPKVYEKGETLNLPKLAKEGHDFGGWYLDSDFKTKFTDQEIKSDITLYAKWDLKKFTVKFMDGDTEVSKQTVEYGKAATAPTPPAKEGKTFKGWDKEFDNITKDLLVYATFDDITFEVKFMDGDTQIGETQTVKYGEKATAPTPTKEGYDFLGWDKKFENVHEDLVVNAKWEIKEFTVTFVYKNGKSIHMETVEYGEDATDVPTDTSLDGYTFKGWDKEFTNIKEDITVTAQYEAIEYSIKYFLEDEELNLTPNKYTIEDEITLPKYEKDGYLFVGWYYQEDFSDEIVTSIQKGEKDNKVFYAKVLDASNKKDLVFELNGGTWSWTVQQVADPAKGISANSNLPKIFMQDFYTYLKDNDLLNAEVVDSSLRVTTWADFSKLTGDPLAHYNKTTTNTSQTTNGYTQLLVDGGSGDETTGDITELVDGFLGADGYKQKYATFAQHLAYLLNDRYTATNTLWTNGASESLAGFVLDGYFYGTQGLLATSNAKHPRFNALRGVIPTPEKGYKYSDGKLVEYTNDYVLEEMVIGLEVILPIPSREDFFFAGWYETEDFSGERVYKINEGDTPADKYYAKWVSVTE